MQTWWMDVNGDSAVLQLREGPQPQPGPGQLLVRVHAAGLNRGEFITGHGLHASPGARAIGFEAAGEVVAAGAGVTGWQPGQRVMGRCPAAFATYAVMDVREAMAVPQRLSWEQAAAIPVVYQVAYDLLLLHGRVAASDWVLVNGVSSGVGVASLQVAKAFGAKVIGTSGAADKLARLREQGLDVALCTREPDFHDAVMQATGGAGVNMVVNNVGGSVFAEEIRCLAFEGKLGMVGYVDGTLKAPIDIEALHARRLILFGVSNKMRTPEQRAADVPGFVRDLMPAVADGRITPLVDRAFPFEQLEAAREHMRADRHLGKIVLASSAG
ncbi:zinc-binding dehydrogenase [Ramlibacter sp. RBP-2]|uniref:Zinc-binding dehydrogenase n=1 Tax=Ramlibacter lithotrophicus TaxID=2606681 RepID=A0A7X6DG24_9BURK|nr:zinc-binding dehydrogenase [Ramlibacter lithotrophicus]NKE66512.1 zinc-binding dehydrogenase [Ramlibacter lithotrophicus]